jgi:hypothetical protein
VTYVGVGTLFAVSRVSVFVSLVAHPIWIAFAVAWVLRPEADLGDLQPLGTDYTATQSYLFWSSLLTSGSFVMATPVLLVGWLLQRLRLGRQVVVCYLICGTALAILRIAVLVSASGKPWTAPWYLLWVLCPEALLLIGTRYDESFVLVALLAVGSFVMTMPILLVGWLSRRHR